jgi:hypothetical protein
VAPNEIAWRRSSRCGSTTCVEVARDGDHYLVRDSKNLDRPALRFSQDEWVEFLDGIQRGEYLVM